MDIGIILLIAVVIIIICTLVYGMNRSIPTLLFPPLFRREGCEPA